MIKPGNISNDTFSAFHANKAEKSLGGVAILKAPKKKGGGEVGSRAEPSRKAIHTEHDPMRCAAPGRKPQMSTLLEEATLRFYNF